MKAFSVVAKDNKIKKYKKCLNLLTLFQGIFKSHKKKNEKKPKKSLKKIVFILGVIQDNHNSGVRLHTSILRYKLWYI